MSARDIQPEQIFVGRTKEMNRLSAILEQVVAGEGRMVMLVGEPGIGKTRTTEEFSNLAKQEDIEVLWGRCYEGEGAPLYWPWVQIVRAYLDNHEPDEVKMHMKSCASAIAEVVPRVAEHLGELPELGPMDDPVSARFRLFDSTASFFKNATAERPLVVVLDDLHWSDGPSLLLLEFIAHQLAETKLLIVGTYRDVEIRRTHPLQQTLGDLTRERLFEKLLLRGLESEAVNQYVLVSSGATETSDLSEQVFKQSEGNPLFMTETVRLLLDERVWVSDVTVKDSGSSSHIPEGIKEVLGRRLNKLSEDCNRVLTTASVAGREFSINILASLIENMNEDQLLLNLEEAMKIGVVEEMTQEFGRYRFNHALTQQTLTEELSLTRRTRVHARIAEAMEVIFAEDADSHALEMVEHFANAETVLGSGRLMRYLYLAGEQSLKAYAYENALVYFKRGLEAIGDSVRNKEVADLHFGLGRAQAATLDEGSIESIRTAFGIYETLGDHTRMVEAATLLHTGLFGSLAHRKWLLQACERCLKIVPEGSPAAGNVFSVLPLARYWKDGDYDRASAAFEQALEIARENDDVGIEQRTLSNWSAVSWIALKNQDAADLGKRALSLAIEVGDLRGEYEALRAISTPLIRMGDITGFQYSDRMVEIVERMQDRRYIISAYIHAMTMSLTRAKFAMALDFHRRLTDLFRVVANANEMLADGRYLAISYEQNDIDLAAEIMRRMVSPVGNAQLNAWTMGGLTMYAFKSDDPAVLETVRLQLRRGYAAISQAAASTALTLYEEGREKYRADVTQNQLIAVLALTAGLVDEAIESFENLQAPLARSGRVLMEHWNSFSADFRKVVARTSSIVLRRHALFGASVVLRFARVEHNV